MRCWQRDEDLLRELARSPHTTGQAARLAGFTSSKKASERIAQLRHAGYLKSAPFYHPGAQAKPELAHGIKLPQQRTLRHSIGITETRVLAAEALPHLSPATLDFYYGHEISMTGGILPDAVIIIHKGDRAALVFLEVDNGTEANTSPHRYSLAGKIRTYAAVFDKGTYMQDFAWAGNFRSFRVGLILPAGREPHVQQLLQLEQHDFVITSTFERLALGLHLPVWQTHDAKTIDLLGRPGELPRELAR